MKGKLGQWAGRLTGLSTPLFGASWEPAVAERDVARNLLTFLEDRRVLYNPTYAETPSYCVQSATEIRQYLTSLLQQANAGGVLAEHLRAMRAAVRHFLDRLHLDGEGDHHSMSMTGHWQSWEFQDALGQLRGVFGVHIAFIAERFDLPVREGLIKILPAAPREDDAHA